MLISGEMLRLGRALSIAFIVIAAGGGCTKRPVLTDSLLERYSLRPSDIQRVQLYTSDEIVLRSEVGDQERSLAGSELRIRGGVREEEIVVPAGTPCVALRVDGNYVLCGFVPNKPELSLWFGLDTKSEPSAQGRRYILAPIANGPTEPGPLVVAKGFLVRWGEKKYRVADPRSWGAHLEVDLEESFNKNRVRQEPPGWKLSEQPIVKGSFSVESKSTPAADPSPPPPAADAGATP